MSLTKTLTPQLHFIILIGFKLNLLIKDGMYKKLSRLVFCLVVVQTSLKLWAITPGDYRISALQEASNKNYPKAIDLLKKQIADDSSLTEAYLRLADFYSYNKSLQQGVTFFQKAGQQNPENPHTYLGLAQLYHHTKDAQNTFKNCKLALTKGSTSPYLVDLLVKSALQLKKTNELGKILRATQKHAAQKHLYDLGYAIWRHEVKNHKKAKSTILDYLDKRKDFYGHKVLGDIEQTASNFQESNRNYRSALKLSKDISQHSSIEIFKSLAANFQALGKPDSADFYFREGLELAQKTAARKEQLEISQAAALFYRHLRMYQKMADACHEAIQVALAINELDYLPELYHDLGYAYEKMTDSERALKYYSLTLKKTEGARNSSLTSKTFLAIGRIYLNLSDPDQAFEYFNQSLEIAKKAGHSNIQYLALLKIADIHKSREEISAAKSAYRKVLRYAQRTQQHSLTETCFIKLSDLYLQPSNVVLKSATYYLNMADALAHQTFQLQFAANHRWMQGKIALQENEIETAEVDFWEAIQLGKEAGSYMSVIAGQAGLIRTYLAAGIPEYAKAYSDSVLISLNNFLDYCFEENSSEFFDLLEDVFIPAITAYSNVGDLSKIYETNEQYKAMIHDIALSTSKYKIKSGMADSLKWRFDLKNKETRDRWQALWRMWNTDQQDNLDWVAKIKSEIDSLNLAKQQQLANIMLRYPKYKIFKPTAETLPELQTKLRQLNGTFIHYFIADAATFITVITKDSIYCKRVNVRATYLETLINKISPFINGKDAPADFGMNPFRLDVAGQVYKLIFEPIKEWISPQNTVIISPDGILSRLPFGALVTNLEALTDNYDFNYANFLIEDFVISYIPFAGFLTLPNSGNKEPHGTLIAFVNSTESAISSSESSANHPSNGKANSRSDENYLKMISSSFGKDKTELYSGEAATKVRFIKESPDYQIIHLALPHILDERSVLYSKLYFSDPAGENILETHEIFNLKLSADLLILSHESKFENSAEGSLSGLLNAANFAGIPSIVTRIWETPGANSPEIFENFYLNLKLGLSKAEALQQAKILYFETINRNPLYWAPYLLHGDPQPMAFQSNSKYWVIYATLLGLTVFITLMVWQFLKIRKESSLEAKSA